MPSIRSLHKRGVQAPVSTPEPVQYSTYISACICTPQLQSDRLFACPQQSKHVSYHINFSRQPLITASSVPGTPSWASSTIYLHQTLGNPRIPLIKQRFDTAVADQPELHSATKGYIYSFPLWSVSPHRDASFRQSTNLLSSLSWCCVGSSTGVTKNKSWDIWI